MSRTITRWAVFIDTVCEGRIPAYHDASGWPVTYATEEEAWREIADDMIAHLEQFVRGERTLNETDFAAPEYVLPVEVEPDGTIWTEDGERFGVHA